MIGYVTLGTNDLEKAAAFYEELLGTLGAKRIFDVETFVAFGTSMTEPSLAISKPFNGEAATVGNGTMVALQMENKDQVKALYGKAMELGATCEGKPGDRGDNFYAAYFRDLDGNKLNAFVIE